eukprot:jgi/Ulvmu1/1298/UM011_0023.1
MLAHTSDLQPLVEDASERPSVEVLESLLGRQVRIITDAKRTFTGCLMCIDHLGNLLIFDAMEHMHTSNRGHERRLNQIIVPLQTIDTAEVLVEQHDKVLQIMLEDGMRSMQVS